MPALAMTDHGNLYGAVEFYQAAEAARRDGADIKAILGCEIYLAPESMHEKKELAGRKRATHLTLLAENNTGWANDRYDTLVTEAARERSPERRQSLYDAAQRILCEEEVPIAPLFVQAINLAVSPRVYGFEPNPMDILFLDRVRVE